MDELKSDSSSDPGNTVKMVEWRVCDDLEMLPERRRWHDGAG
jgi:hypothetical protein